MNWFNSSTASLARADSQLYLTGTGIGSITAAVTLIQKCAWTGSNIHIIEEQDEKYAGGCCDAQYDEEKDQYSMRGSRMFEEEVYRCTKALWGLIPSIENPGKTALDDHNKNWNECRVDTKVRLIFDGVKKDDGLHLGLSKADMYNMAKLMLMPEWMLGEKKISDMFTPKMFRSNFWYMWRTTFAFHQWHSAIELKRYMHLFFHTMPHFHDMTPIQRTKYTNFHSFVLPALKLLEDKGVNIHYQSKITDAEFSKVNGKQCLTGLHIENRIGENQTVDVRERDFAFLTLGSMVAEHSYGANDTPAQFPPSQQASERSCSWTLWEKIASKHSGFGHPEVFTRDPEESRMLAFTSTFNDPLFRSKWEKLVDRKMGETGQLTLPDSPWFLEVTAFRQPLFPNQSDDKTIIWGYGLHDDEVGRFVPKKMRDCSGREILEELLGHLGFNEDEKRIVLDTSNTIPCMLPYGISQFNPRRPGDRPRVVPEGASNFAFIGQYVEIPNHCVFTTEYSIRGAMIAIQKLIDPTLDIPKIYWGEKKPTVVAATIRRVFA
ncbi:oleate hydratase [Paraglaciecola sp. 25GB23A]|uniref:oleate hydratase n=1 Tax=Paraglaciecola sp. 25GB23A TaxID=3156068 RepID=UPI0032AFAA7C